MKHTQLGQGTVEFILLMVLGVALFMGAMKILKNADVVGAVTQNPWKVFSGMIECGVWQPCGISTPVANMHPSNRPLSFKPAGQP